MQGKINCESINGHLNSGQLNGQLSIDDLNIEIDQPVLNASLLQTSGLTGTINPGQGSGGHGREYHAGQGIDITGSTISVNVDGQTIIVNDQNQLVANVEGDCNIALFDLNYLKSLEGDALTAAIAELIAACQDTTKAVLVVYRYSNRTFDYFIPIQYNKAWTQVDFRAVDSYIASKNNGNIIQTEQAYFYILNARTILGPLTDGGNVQPLLTAGDNITISNNVISATAGGLIYLPYHDGDIIPADLLAKVLTNPENYYMSRESRTTSSTFFLPYYYDWTYGNGKILYSEYKVESKSQGQLNREGYLIDMTTGLVQSTNIVTSITTYINTSNNGINVDQSRPMSPTLSIDYTKVQEKLTAGNNIQINGSTISATDTTYTAGQNITIDANNVISASGDSVYGIIHYDPNNEPTFNSVKAIIDSGRIPVIIYDPADGNYPDTTDYQPLTEHSGIYNFAGCSSTGSIKYIDFIKSVYLPFPIDSQTGSTRLLHIGLYVDENDNWTFDANVKTD